MGVSMLIKGPLTLGLVFGAGAITALVRRSPRLLRPFASPAGIALFVAITVPWYVAANARIPGLLHDLVTRRLFGGLASSADFHGHSVWIVWLPLVGAFPWLATLPRTLVSTLRGGGWRRGIVVPAFVLAASAPLLFTFSKARLFSYASPAFPWLALLVAFGWPTPGSAPDGEASRGRRLDLSRATLGAALVAVCAAIYVVVGIEARPLVAGTACVGAAFAVVAASGLGLRRAFATPFTRAALVVTGLMVAGGAGAVADPGQFDASKSLADAIARMRRPGDEVGAVMPYTGDWGLLPWYLEGPVRFFDYPSEPMIVAPEKFAPDRFLPKTALGPWFRAKERRFLLIRKRDRDRKDYVADVPSHLLAECGRYVILTNLPLDAGR
jgi:4-amino-4-deoxy-L-arabinose transferase-like glycosyltransferase